ncbi:single-stranded-DNA-specific exonuclease RecJ [Candidatus Falkowbacteria bacterium CG_4_9_14_3_um_filter_38_19]|uniref:Single-stranded-DNA-specific exonuclease RecJ n=1 Tax=Candidatus Falkowbacteria bacterium CG_4_9_14_3_um_filter_38_19 TaxID=1974559 RepID=A0A2M8AD84_9BACT|nr:MAG: single-stranded-DNA-specific exonuclease RecJ [Candidatus Falkowbacteria bacterium CG_4_9_14_3_um_filter_38_19]
MLVIWKILPKISENFVKQYPQYNRVILQLLSNRNLKDQADIRKFLYPNYKDLLDPFLFKQMEAAVNLIIQHIKAGSKIIVYGDYDADGITAATVLVETLVIFKAQVDVYIPDRVSEGYGLNKKAINELAQAGAKLIITVDNGIRNREEVEYLKQLGLDIVITDHHEVPQDKNAWPVSLIINQMAEDYPFKFLAGVGVAFKVALALIKKSKLAEEYKERLEEKILDLVAVGTVADCVSLIGENRILVQAGLKILNQKRRIGLTELINIAQINSADKLINAWNIGWQIAPRLNSAGRLEHANTAFRLLITKDKKEAQTIAKKLNDQNSQRQKITDEIVEYCRQQIDQRAVDDKILIITSPNLAGASKLTSDETGREDNQSWPEGVIGLVAGRLCEQYSEPAIVITQYEGEIKGSGRSIEEFDITQAIEQFKNNFTKFGGHAAACGFTLKSPADLVEFSQKLKQLANDRLQGIDLTPKLMIEAELLLADIDEELVQRLEDFEPFGEDNPRPKFVSFNLTIMDKVIMGANSQHIKFRFNNFWALAFGQTEKWGNLKIGDKVDLVYYLEFNEFNGHKAIQLKVIDIKSHNS